MYNLAHWSGVCMCGWLGVCAHVGGCVSPSMHWSLNNTRCSNRKCSIACWHVKLISRETARHFKTFFGTRATYTHLSTHSQEMTQELLQHMHFIAYTTHILCNCSIYMVDSLLPSWVLLGIDLQNEETRPYYWTPILFQQGVKARGQATFKYSYWV